MPPTLEPPRKEPAILPEEITPEVLEKLVVAYCDQMGILDVVDMLIAYCRRQTADADRPWPAQNWRTAYIELLNLKRLDLK